MHSACLRRFKLYWRQNIIITRTSATNSHYWVVMLEKLNLEMCPSLITLILDESAAYNYTMYVYYTIHGTHDTWAAKWEIVSRRNSVWKRVRDPLRSSLPTCRGDLPWRNLLSTASPSSFFPWRHNEWPVRLSGGKPEAKIVEWVTFSSRFSLSLSESRLIIQTFHHN